MVLEVKSGKLLEMWTCNLYVRVENGLLSCMDGWREGGELE